MVQTIRDGPDQAIAEVTRTSVPWNSLCQADGLSPIISENALSVNTLEGFEKRFQQPQLPRAGGAGHDFHKNRRHNSVGIVGLD
jgi:hypothetical protein